MFWTRNGFCFRNLRNQKIPPIYSGNSRVSRRFAGQNPPFRERIRKQKIFRHFLENWLLMRSAGSTRKQRNWKSSHTPIPPFLSLSCGKSSLVASLGGLKLTAWKSWRKLRIKKSLAHGMWDVWYSCKNGESLVLKGMCLLGFLFILIFSSRLDCCDGHIHQKSAKNSKAGNIFSVYPTV